jgi:hypothetical protein
MCGGSLVDVPAFEERCCDLCRTSMAIMAITFKPAVMGEADGLNDALLPLQLRIHLLETLLTGSSASSAALPRSSSSTSSLARRANEAITKLHDAVEASGSGAIKRFLDECMFFRSTFLHDNVVVTQIGTSQTTSRSHSCTLPFPPQLLLKERFRWNPKHSLSWNPTLILSRSIATYGRSTHSTREVRQARATWHVCIIIAPFLSRIIVPNSETRLRRSS